MYKTADTSIDAVVLTLKDGLLHALVHTRPNEPFQGVKALPGGYVHTNEDDSLEAAARRILKLKAGIVPGYLEQLETVGNLARDPRGWSIAIVYFALMPVDDLLRDMLPDSELIPVDNLPGLAFDHETLLRSAVQRVKAKATYSALPCYLLPALFTLADLQIAVEQLTGIAFNKSAFRRKLESLGFVQAEPGAMLIGNHRPAQLYRVKSGPLKMFDRSWGA